LLLERAPFVADELVGVVVVAGLQEDDLVALLDELVGERAAAGTGEPTMATTFSSS